MENSAPTKWYLKVLFMILPFVLMTIGLEVALRVWGQVRNVGPSFSAYDPIYGKSLKRSFQCTRTAPEFEMTFSTNSHGFRGPEFTETSTGGVVVLGDSFTMGYGVSDGEEYVAVVRQALDARFGEGRVPIVNMGMGANGNGRWIKLLENRVADYKPRLVVMQFLQNDFGDNMRERLYSLDEAGALHAQAIPPMSGMRKLQEPIEAVPGLAYLHLLSFVKQMQADLKTRAAWGSAPKEASKKAAPKKRTAPNYPERLTMALVEKAVQICRDNHWPVVMLVTGVHDFQFELLERLTQRLGVELIVIPSKADQPELYFEVDGHWNVPGHKFAGEVLSKRVLGGPELK
jgi:lysophospholipase L1-like esterase